MAAKYPDDNQELQDNIQLCPLDQQNPGSCSTGSCSDFHICRDYLLNNQCTEFETNGKKSNLSAQDKDIFDKIAQLVRTPKSTSSEKIISRVTPSIVLNDDHNFGSTSKQTNPMGNGRGRLSLTPSLYETSLPKSISSDDKASTLGKRFSISTRLPLTNADHTQSMLTNSDHSQSMLTNSDHSQSMLTNSDHSQSMLTNSDHSQSMLTNSMDLSSNPRRLISTYSMDLRTHHLDRPETKTRFPTTAHSIADVNNDTSSIAATTSRHERSFGSSIRSFFSKSKERNPAKAVPNESIRSDIQLKYIFDKYTKDDELSYLFGPTRTYLVERKNYQIFASGYCRCKNVDEEKEIERSLRLALPPTLETDRIQLINDDLAFLISTSAAERIFEQNQISYSIMSEPYTASLLIEVIGEAKADHTRSRSLPSRKVLSPRSSINQDKSHLPVSDGKIRISRTNSSISVIYDDITQTKVDLMVCVNTSVTLLNSVLAKAGQSVISKYTQQCRSQNPVILNGGMTSAQKILFVPWEVAVESTNTMKAEQSLSNLVKRCIEEAYQLNMTSISFPSIGTGKIGLDPNKVCESMISAASECLHKYKMDVLFVIYPPSGNDQNQQSYEIFRAYLDNLCKQSRPARAASPLVAYVPQSLTIPVGRSQQIRRTGECKRISTVSDTSNITFYHQQLVKSLERLIMEKTFDLSLIQQRLVDEVELLIDICLEHHVLPRIDFAKGELILRGDRDSCSQCIYNLRNGRLVNNYTILNKTEKKAEEIKLNIYVSAKIDEAFANDESNIRIEDDNKTVFNIDLKNLTVHIDGDRQAFVLYRDQLNDSKISPPRSWSPLHMIRTVDILHSYPEECVYNFEQTMPQADWRILGIDTIENWPLYVHYTKKKSKDETLAFHGCSFSSVQSIIHYGLHSTYDGQLENPIRLTREALSSHVRNARRSTDGKYYMFVVRGSNKIFNQDSINLSNDDAHLVLPTYLIVYQRQIIL